MAKLAFVFPGQGSQSIGMLAEFATAYPTIKAVFAEASASLNYDLWELIQSGPEEKLTQTEFAQPALLTAGVAVWRVWQEQGGKKPELLAGHSLGEYTALTCAEVFSFQDAVQLVRDRGRFMQVAFQGKSAMVALVGLHENDVNAICQEAAQGQVLVPANYNSLGQIVLAGELAAAERAAALATAKGAKIAKILPVSVPSHCDLMRPAAEKLQQRLATISMQLPKIPVIQNADVAMYSDPAQIRDSLVRQLFSPVRWVETIQKMIQLETTTILECGPGKVLTGLNRRIDNTVKYDILGNVANFKTMLGST